ncbi:MAG: polyprenyl synthetase family protein [Pseudomonadota bacterium]
MAPAISNRHAANFHLAHDNETSGSLPDHDSGSLEHLEATRQQIDEELILVKGLMRESLGAPEAWPAVAASLYHLDTGGSYLRARFALMSGIAYGATLTHRTAAAAATELVHNASLVHDDICDGDTSRRGQLSVWQRDNPAVALCSGDLLLTAAFRVALRSDSADHCMSLVKLLTDRVSQVVAGQSIEVADPCPQEGITLSDYLEATLAKTSPLIALPLEAGAMGGTLSAAQQALLLRFANAVGLSYQIIDDLDDVDINVDSLHRHDSSTHHRYHAWAWHGSRRQAYPPYALRDTMQRALKHADAALTRAERLKAEFPTLLAHMLNDIIDTLRRRLRAHQATILTLSRDLHQGAIA